MVINRVWLADGASGDKGKEYAIDNGFQHNQLGIYGQRLVRVSNMYYFDSITET